MQNKFLHEFLYFLKDLAKKVKLNQHKVNLGRLKLWVICIMVHELKDQLFRFYWIHMDGKGSAYDQNLPIFVVKVSIINNMCLKGLSMYYVIKVWSFLTLALWLSFYQQKNIFHAAFFYALPNLISI